MSLVKQNVAVNFGQGLDTKTDNKLVVPGKLLQLENGVFNSFGALNKRNGYKVLGKLIQNTTNSIEMGKALSIYNGELNLYTGNKLYSYVEANDSWIDKGSIVSLVVNSSSIVKNSYSQNNVVGNSLNNVTVYAWEDSRGGVRYSVLDQTTGTKLISDSVVSSGASRPKIITLGAQNVVIFYYVAADTALRYKVLSTPNPSVLGAEQTISANLDGTNPNYDVIRNANRMYVAFNHTSGYIQLDGYRQDFALEVSENITSETADQSLNLNVDSNQRLWISYYDGSDIKTSVYSFSLVEVLAPTVVENLTETIPNIISIINGTEATIIYEIANSNKSNHYIKKNTMTIGGTAGTPEVLLRSVGLASKEFTLNQETYFNVIHQSELQSTYFTINSEGIIAAKLNPGLAGNLIDNGCITEVIEIANESFLFPNQEKGALESEDNTVFSPLGVSSSTLSFDSDNRFQNTQLNNLHIVGGILQNYDGAFVTEHGFHLYPEGVTVANATSGGALQAGTYQYQVCYEWTDNLGQIHRSAPSIPVSITLPTGSTLTKTGASITTGSPIITNLNNTTDLFVGQVVTNANLATGSTIISIDSATQITLDRPATGTAASQSVATVFTNKPTVTIPTLRLTEKKGAKTNIRLVVYRTEANGTVFRRITSVNSPTFNDVTTDTVSHVDELSAYSSLFNDLIYTTGGVLENIAPPACSLITTWNNRVVIAGLEDKLKIWYSKQVLDGNPVEFTDFFELIIDSRGGDITALEVLDDNLIIFKQDSIYFLSGQGPNDTGLQNDIGAATLITTDVGCNNPNSVVITPEGLMFKSPKGIYLLSRGLQVAYVGAEVEGFNQELITSSTLVADVNQVRFTTNNNITLVYDYFVKQWGTFTNQTSEDSVIFKQDFTFLRSNGEVWKETPGKYLDNQSFIKLRFTTSWLPMGGVQGFQRAYRMSLLGEYKSPHQMLVSVAYDYNPNNTQFATIDVNDTYVVDSYGSGEYGAETPYGGEYPLYQFKTHLTKQKCQAIRFTFEDNQNLDIGAFGAGFSMANISIEAGIKRGLNKRQDKNTFSTSN